MLENILSAIIMAIPTFEEWYQQLETDNNFIYALFSQMYEAFGPLFPGIVIVGILAIVGVGTQSAIITGGVMIFIGIIGIGVFPTEMSIFFGIIFVVGIVAIIMHIFTKGKRSG